MCLKINIFHFFHFQHVTKILCKNSCVFENKHFSFFFYFLFFFFFFFIFFFFFCSFFFFFLIFFFFLFHFILIFFSFFFFFFLNFACPSPSSPQQRGPGVPWQCGDRGREQEQEQPPQRGPHQLRLGQRLHLPPAGQRVHLRAARPALLAVFPQVNFTANY